MVSAKDSCFFAIIDLAGKRLEHIIPDPFNAYIATSFDIDQDSVYVASALSSDTLYALSLKTARGRPIRLHFNKSNDPGQVLLNGHQFFIYKNVWGMAMVNTTGSSAQQWHTQGTVDPESSDLSFPMDSTVTLFSGYVINSTVELLALGKNDSIKWAYSIDTLAYPEQPSAMSLSWTRRL